MKYYGILFDYNGVLVIGNQLARGVQQILPELSAQFTLGIITRAIRADVQEMLERENIAHFFQTIIAAEDIQRGKPDPEGYLKGIKALNLPPENIIAVEDTLAGVQSAKAAGLKCIAVQSAGSRQVLDADATVQNISELTPDFVRQVIDT
jgi:beta-phosphoglucomutase-like phosphatase (HAD superfamily)